MTKQHEAHEAHKGAHAEAKAAPVAPTLGQGLAAASAPAKAEATEVTLTDGRTATFGVRSLLNKTLVEVDGKPAVQMDFKNGETRTFIVPDALFAKFAAHGLSQKLGDLFSGIKATQERQNSGEFTQEDAIAAIDQTYAAYVRGEWAERSVGSGESGLGDLARALVTVSGKSGKEVTEYLSKMPAAEKTALRKFGPVADAIKAIVAEREAKQGKKAAGIDAAALLGGLLA